MDKLRKALLVLGLGMGLGMGASYPAWAVTPQACERYWEECEAGIFDSCEKYRRYRCNDYLPIPGR